MDQVTSPTKELAAWIAADHDIPVPSNAALDLAQISIIDTIACAIAATREPAPWAFKRTRMVSDALPASIIGIGGGALARDAALLNAMLAHMLDFDDGDMVSRSHLSCILFPALFAAAEERHLSGKVVLESYLVGYYVSQLIGRITGRAMGKRGYQVSGLIGVLGATAALCRLLNLNADKTATALGIAATTAAGLRANFGTDMKPYHAARAAYSAIEAVEMAKAGITASQNILEAKDGFIWVLAQPELVTLLQEEVNRLRTGDYSIEAEPPNIKLYACCHSAHPNIAALLRIRPHIINNLDQVQEIIAEAPTSAATFLVHPRPKTGLEGKFSMEACMAVALLDGAAGIEQFTDESIQRTDVQAMLRIVRFEATDRMEKIHIENHMPGKVTVKTDKETFEEEVRDPRGCRTDPCNLSDIITKFRECAVNVLSPQQTDSVLTLLSDFKAIEDVCEVGEVLRGNGINHWAV